MSKKVVLWEDAGAGLHKSKIEADLSDLREDIHEIVANGTAKGYVKIMDPLLVTNFLLANWGKLVPFVTAYINLEERKRIADKENEDEVK